MNAVKPIHYPGITWIVHIDKITLSSYEQQGHVLPWWPLATSHNTGDLSYPVAPSTCQQSKTDSEQLLFLFICFQLNLLKLWNCMIILHVNANNMKYRKQHQDLECAWIQHAGQRFLQFQIQTKHFNIPNSLGFPSTVVESFQSLLWNGLWSSGSPKSATIIWCTTAAKVNTDKWQPDQNFPASWWRIKTCLSPQIARTLQKPSLPQQTAKNLLPSLVFTGMFIVI